MIRTIILLLLCSCLITQALAYGTVNARVTDVRIDQDGKGMVFFDAAIGASPPGCVNAAYANALAFNTNTAGGRSILAVVLTAKANGNLISAIGTGSCALYGSSSVEDWSYGHLK